MPDPVISLEGCPSTHSSWVRSELIWVWTSTRRAISVRYKNFQTLEMNCVQFIEQIFATRKAKVIYLMINSREAIAAIIGDILIFYDSKNLNCIGVLSFYDSKRSIGEVLFLNQFYWSDFWSGKWNAWKNFLGWTKVKSGAKSERFLFIPLFLRERKIELLKNFL